MSISRVAIIFDDRSRPETTGTYCRRALESLVQAWHFLPDQLSDVSPSDFDLFVQVDDGLEYPIPGRLRPRAYWAIDTHLEAARCLRAAAGCDFVFTAQRDGVERLQQIAVPATSWLPLAADTQIHRPHSVTKQWDVCFIGNQFPGSRSDLLRLIFEHYPQTLIDRRYFEEMARAYSAARVGFNRSIKNDLNMRVFETLACGPLLVTNDLTDNGQAELFQDGKHLVTYNSAEDLLDKLEFYLRRDDVRRRVAQCGLEEVRQRHTYGHRMKSLLQIVERHASAEVSVPVQFPSQESDKSKAEPADEPQAKEPAYFEFERPELLELIPRTVRCVLEIGCGGGRLGAAVKARQSAKVVGVELDPRAARLARRNVDQVIEGDAERLTWRVTEELFDCLVCGDVLEHMEDPWKFLQQARAWLTPGAAVVASIPNVRHHSVVAGLVEGNWTYEPAGLLDDTHRWFFTRSNIEQLFQESGYDVQRLAAVAGPGYEQWEQQGRPGEVQVGCVNLRGLDQAEAEEFFVYQYLVLATASPGSQESATNIPVARHDPGCLESPQPNHGPSAVTDPATQSEQLGCVLAIRNRPAVYLRRTLETFALQTLQPIDRVLLDYGSTRRHTQEYRAQCEEFGWRYVRHLPARPCWNLSDAYNRAVEALLPEVSIVFKSDVDVLLGEDVLRQAEQRGREKLCLFSCQGAAEDAKYPAAFSSPEELRRLLESAPRPKSMDGEGIHAFPLAWFSSIGGYDRTFDGWGYEDSDLRLRAERSIGIQRDERTLLLHQWHPRVARPPGSESNHRYYQGTKTKFQLVRNGGKLVEAAPKPPAVSSSPSVDDVDFIIKSFLRPQALRRLLESVRRHYPSVAVTVADDGNLRSSSDGDSRQCCQWIDADERTGLLELPFDYGPDEGRNFLVEHTRRPFLLLLDDDFCFTAETRVEQLLADVCSDPQVGVAGGLCRDHREGTVQLRRFAGTLEVQDGRIQHHLGRWRESGRRRCDITLQFALFRRDVFHEVRWEGRSGAHHYDLFLQLRQTPWQVMQNDQVVIDHYPQTPSLPGYRQRRDHTQAAQQWLLECWHVDELWMNDACICRRPLPDEGQRKAFAKGVALASAVTDDPQFNDWTISRDCWQKVQHLLQPGMRTLECGSGLSTLLFEAAGCRHTALEHDRRYAAANPAVVLAPLSGSPPWYDWQPSAPYDLILVDGPPMAIGRRGLLRVLEQCLHESTILVLDDTNRPAEQTLVDEISARFGYQFHRYNGNKRSFDVGYR